MRKNIESVKRGDVIVEGRTEIEVKKVVPHACSSLGTHINDRYCYDRGWVVRTKDNNVDPAETALGDRPEDYEKMWKQFEKETLKEILTDLEYESQSRLY